MTPALILKIIIIVTGLWMFAIAVISLAKRKMNESFCLAMGVASVAIILAGILLNPGHWQEHVSGLGLALILVVFFAMVYAAYFISVKISDLSRKNQELAIQVSLLNQENERILIELSEITGKDIRDL